MAPDILKLVMAGLVPAIHVYGLRLEDVDAIGARSDAVLRTATDKRGHDGGIRTC
jgi:hypothetical protein